jgi:hypothetical protein
VVDRDESHLGLARVALDFLDEDVALVPVKIEEAQV